MSSNTSEIIYDLRNYLINERIVAYKDFFSLNNNRIIDENYLSQILLYNYQNHSLYSKNACKILDELKLSGHKQVCQYQFKKNDIVWICRQCQRDETCVLCNTCFQSSNHDSHEVYFYHSASGGCCDCGDVGAWDSNGFCNKHGNLLDDPTQLVSEDIANIARELFNVLAEGIVYILQTFKNCCFDSNQYVDDEDLFHLIVINDDYHSFDQVTVAFAELNITGSISSQLVTEIHEKGSAVVKVGSWFDVKPLVDSLRQHGLLVALAPARNNDKIQSVVNITLWLYKIANISDGYCRMICNSLDFIKINQLFCIDAYLPKKISMPLHHLYLTVMADTTFKTTMACCYADSYLTVVENFGNGIGTSECSLFGLSVQFLNRDVYVNEMISSHNFLYNMSTALKDLLLKPLPSDTNHLVIAHRRYSLVIGDYKIIFSIAGMSRLYLTERLNDFLDILCHYQGIHPQTRLLSHHVEYESNDWMAAFNLSVGIGALHEYLLNWLEDKSSVEKIIYQVDNTTVLISAKDLILIVMNRINSINIVAVKNKSTFHLLIHRFLASIIKECLCYPHHSNLINELMYTTTSATSFEYNNMINTILNTTSFASQISCGLWKRNGRIMLDQLLNYNDIPFCRLFKDLDVLLLQILTFKYTVDSFVTHIFVAYEIYDFVLPLTSLSFGSQTNRRAELTLILDEVLLLFIHLLSDLPYPSDYDINTRLKPMITKAFIHILAKGPCSYSTLIDFTVFIPEITKLNPNFIESILSNIADIREGNGLEPSKYILKKNQWIHYDSKYHYISTQVHNSISENRPKITENQPIVSNNFHIHECFINYRYNLLSNQFIQRLIKFLLYKYTSESIKMLQKSDINVFYSWVDQFDYSCSGTTFLNVLQILTIFIHSYIEFSNNNQINNNDNIVNYFLDEIEVIREDTSTSNIINNFNDCIKSNNLNDMSETSSNNIKLKVPSLLCTLLDLADCLNQSNQNLTTSSHQRNYHHLLWILDSCKEIDERMKNYINQRINIKNNSDKLKQLQKKKLKAKEKILNKIKLNADSFSKLMDNIDSSEDIETDNKIDIKTNDKVDDTDVDSKADSSADNICIICHSNNSDNIGYLALTQVSTILTKKLKQLHIKSDDTFDHPIKCYSHISFCGHSMHYSCYDDFYATVISRSDIQNNLIIDTNKGQFQCPLCKKLNNMIIPHSNIIPSNNRKRFRDSNDQSNDQISNDTVNFVSNKYPWINWYLSFPSLSNNDVDVSVDQRINLDDVNVPHDLINFNLLPVISQKIEESFTSKKSIDIKLNSNNNETDIHVNTIETSPVIIPVVNEVNRNRSNQPVSRLRNMFQGLIHRIYPTLHHEEVHRDIHQLMDLDDDDDDLIFNAIVINDDELELSNNTIMNATMTSNTKFLDKIWYRFVTDICAPIDSYMSTPVPYSIPLYVNNNSYEINPTLIYYLNTVIKSVAFTISLDESESSIPGYFLISNGNNINDIKLIDKVIHGLVGLINSCNIRSVIEESIQQSLFGINTNYNVNPLENDLISGPILLKNLANVTIIVILLHLSNQSNKSTVESANSLHNDTPTSDHFRYSNIKSSIQNIIIIHLIQTILDVHVQNIDESYNSNMSVNDDFRGIYFTVNVIESLLSKYFPVTYLSNAHINYIIHKWLSFINCVSHIVYRLLPDLLVHPSNNVNKEYKTNYQEITTNQLVNVLELFDLTILLETTLTNEIYLQYSIFNIWISDLFNYISKSNKPINELIKLTNMCDYNITNTLSLIPLSNSYTSLHGQVTSLCNYEFPAICLICGEILDGNGKGHCTKHVQYCNGETGMYFLVQDCTILITHGPRACYLPAPYVDEFGERHRHHRGKPLHLDQRMYDMLRKIWISHNIPREVVQKRSNSTRVIIFGHY